ncbi:MAG TPA: exodeoxyribonuclease VII large subunit, partial [Sphingomicrobium sp.]
SGHVYFVLKDEQAQVRCVLFRHKAQFLGFALKDGLHVEVRATPTIYEARGDFQLNVETARVSGLGALYEQFARLKSRLEAAGWFAPARKRALPPFPRAVGIVTSRRAAALSDVLTTLARRTPSLPVILYPASVQGSGAAVEIAAAIATANARAEVDVLIVCRGGGSIEDLWAFNEEEVVRAAAESPIPLISAVGHETDTTLIDHAADLRAPTPTAAAELAVPVRSELLAAVAELAHRAQHCLARRTDNARERYQLAVARWPEPPAIFAPIAQRLDEVGDRLPRSLAARAGAARADMNLVAGRLRRELLDDRIARLGEKLAAAWKMAELAHPERPLTRGYVRVTDRAGQTLTHVADARAAREVSLRFGDGSVDAVVGGQASPPVERKPRRSYIPPQPGLFDQAEE